MRRCAASTRATCVYREVTGWESFEPWLTHHGTTGAAAHLGDRGNVPPEWYEGNVEVLEGLGGKADRAAAAGAGPDHRVSGILPRSRFQTGTGPDGGDAAESSSPRRAGAIVFLKGSCERAAAVRILAGAVRAGPGEERVRQYRGDAARRQRARKRLWCALRRTGRGCAVSIPTRTSTMLEAMETEMRRRLLEPAPNGPPLLRPSRIRSRISSRSPRRKRAWRKTSPPGWNS